MRGKLEVKEFKSTATRIIPAHAGQTSTLGMTVVRPSDHPRACGANFATLVGSQLQNGSSPRMRGKRPHQPRQHQRRRIIPAHAGQTAWIITRPIRVSDHPRACGANRGMGMSRSSLFGSSPRMRGKRVDTPLRAESRRIIPAHAGQTTPTPCPAAKASDHPRACGANIMVNSYDHTNNGSSPRMRGKPVGGLPALHQHRIIPAHAGQTQTAYLRHSRIADHPRACGANGEASRILP